MSQWFIGATAGSLPPVVPTSFVTDVNSPSVPIANVENVFGGTITTNNTKGIQTDGSSGSNTLTVQLTNRINGTGQTTDAVTPVNLYTFPLGAVAGTYLFTTQVIAYAVDTGTGLNPLGASYASYRAVRTTGASGVLINALTSFLGEEGIFTDAEVSNNIVGNSVNIQVTGIVGKTIDWYVLTTYIFVS